MEMDVGMELEDDETLDLRFSPSPQFGNDSDWDDGFDPPVYSRAVPVPIQSGAFICEANAHSSDSDWEEKELEKRRLKELVRIPRVDYTAELFRHAVISGDVKLAKNIYEKKVAEGESLENKIYHKTTEPKKQNPDDVAPGWSILMIACAAGPNLDMIEYLLGIGASPNYICSGTKFSALHALISEKPKSNNILETCLDLLVKAGLHFDKVFVEQANPLVIATNYNHYFMVEYLLKKGINPNLQYVLEGYNESETTALHVAVSKGNGAIVKLLLEHGADVELLDGSGLMPMDYAVVEKQMGIAQLLFKICQSGWVPGKPFPITDLPLEQCYSNSSSDGCNEEESSMQPGPLFCVIEKLKIQNLVKYNKYNDTKEELFKFLSIKVKDIYEACGSHVGNKYTLLDGLRNYHNTRYHDSALYQLPIHDESGGYSQTFVGTGRFDPHKKVLGMKHVKSALENLNFQPGHMETDIIFLLDRIEEQKQVIHGLKEPRDKDIISKHFGLILESIEEYEKVHEVLEDCIKKNDGDPELEIHDFIGPHRDGSWSSRWHLICVGALTVAGIAIGAAAYNYKSNPFQ